MKKDSVKTKLRLLDAAKQEFSRFGLAGGRVDRIAKNAGCNKQLIYSYFQNKEGLFAAVYERMVEDVMQKVPFDAEDIPGYVSRIVTLFNENKDIVRLSTWHRLERLAPESEAIRKTSLGKINAVKKAQKNGKLNKNIPAAELLALISQLSMAGQLAAPNEPDTIEFAAPEYIIEAVRRLCAVHEESPPKPNKKVQ